MKWVVFLHGIGGGLRMGVGCLDEAWYFRTGDEFLYKSLQWFGWSFYMELEEAGHSTRKYSLISFFLSRFR